MKKILFILTAAFLLAAGLAGFAQDAASGSIVVTADTKLANPTIIFTSGLSDQALSAKILSDLNNCGWFTVLKSGSAAYLVSAKGRLNNFTVTVTNNAGVAVCSFNIADSKDVDSAAHTAVDTILNRLFGIQGICRSKIVFSAYVNAKNREIFICDFDGSNIRQLTHENTLCIQPVWAADGKSFLYIRYNPAHTNLMQYNMGLDLSRRLVVGAGGSLSPDGKTIAMTNNVDLFTRPLEGGKLKQITSGKAAETSPRWSPDGKKLCYVSDVKGGRPLIYVIAPVAGGKGTEISGLVGSERTAPSWSADNKLAYCAKIGRNYELRVAKLSAGGKSADMEKIGTPGNDTFPGEDPSWAPDNRHVTLTGNNAIYVIDTWLGKKRTLVTGTRELGHSSWSPILTK